MCVNVPMHVHTGLSFFGFSFAPTIVTGFNFASGAAASTVGLNFATTVWSRGWVASTAAVASAAAPAAALVVAVAVAAVSVSALALTSTITAIFSSIASISSGVISSSTER